MNGQRARILRRPLVCSFIRTRKSRIVGIARAQKSSIKGDTTSQDNATPLLILSERNSPAHIERFAVGNSSALGSLR